MKNISLFALLFTVFLGSAQDQSPKAFYKGCLVTSITGGPSRALFTTYSNEGKKVHSDIAPGIIDPLIMEYGLTDKIGIGFSKGGENYNINANKFYNAGVAHGSEMMWTSTKYLTADISYHPYKTKRLDVSVFTSLGYFKVIGECYSNNEWTCNPSNLFSYKGRGVVVRSGVRSRFYFTKRFGLMAMAYGSNGLVKAKIKPSSVSDQKNNSGYYTNVICGGLEFGLCFRIFKQKGVKEEHKLAKLIKHVKEEKEESDKVPLFRFVWD
ncbi:MAG: hypothetical protein SGJ15_04945 [Bacteroidota bacterium]|nr:hypothetical protein [Bacteroidota bacterium]